MKKNYITLDRVNLHYASVAYKERSLKSLLSGAMKKNAPQPKVTDIHALKDISLSIEHGERVGLIGHNGAGKSTFLKTVAGLYPISSGKLSVKGKIRSLFDLSLGFESEATGRENILYRGLLLGLKPAVIRQKEEEIIDFAGLGEFINYPIKTYSAGMQVRLAFAISTSFSGDILLLDEVIGAGDAQFMAKAKQRMHDLVQNSEILILASHDTASLRNFCQRLLVFQQGTIIFDGPVEQGINAYNQIHGITA